ncbi:glycosyltransferase family 4 protein [Flavobacterium sp. UBA6031]|uniref:glycosyltransferase family 4 protein n=1 Tax=Flavobacterium sp. UBA6031 TaxID=1946551 RepID=UPI0025B9C12B|nr:glycosyltransferase family 4 protein [Flavobacterium sp. UBA6031]
MKITRKIHIGIVCDQFGNFDRGGAEVQIDNTVNALNKIDGITTEIITSQTKDIDRFDLIHFFKSSISYYFFIKLIKKRGIPYVLSTIIYPENIFFETIKYKFLHYCPIINKLSVVKLLYAFWENASMLFPNTDKELEFLRSIGVKTNAKIIPNGLNLLEMNEGDENAFYDAYPSLKGKRFVLNVARIDKRKNQRRLVLACKELDVPVVLIGNNLDKESFEEIKKINYSKLYYLGAIFDKRILFGAFKACSVFCLPSTMETPGIAAMEAAYFNKPLVITKFGGTQYYFKDKAYYVDWRSVDEIKKGIDTMIKNTFVETRKLMEQFSWDKIAEMYVDEYLKILK